MINLNSRHTVGELYSRFWTVIAVLAPEGTVRLEFEVFNADHSLSPFVGVTVVNQRSAHRTLELLGGLHLTRDLVADAVINGERIADREIAAVCGPVQRPFVKVASAS